MSVGASGTVACNEVARFPLPATECRMPAPAKPFPSDQTLPDPSERKNVLRNFSAHILSRAQVNWKGCHSILLSLLSSGFCGKNTFYHLRFVQFHLIWPDILPTPCTDKNKNWTWGTGFVHDYKHSKGTLLVTMLPELHLYLILYVPH